jgi:transcriptional regulator
MAGSELELLQGTLDVLILKALSWGPMHGHAVARWIRGTTGGELEILDGALYTALHRMEQKGWVDADWGVSDRGRRAKFYRLTTRGRQQLRVEAATWTRYAAAVAKVLQAAAPAAPAAQPA